MTKILIIFLLFFLSLKAETTYFDFTANKQISKSNFLSQLEQNKYILLGEQHDNNFHHDAKIEIFDHFKNKNIKIATEHLVFGENILWQQDTKKSLLRGGFDFQGWQWPQHENLYNFLNQNNLHLSGANLSDNDLLAIVKNQKVGSIAQPEEKLKRFELEKNAQEILENELVASHCGFIKKEQTKPLQIMQLAKDVAMSETLIGSRSDFVFLIAGNNHIRKDFAIPKILEKSGVHNYIVVGFFGKKDFEENRSNLTTNFDLAVITQDVEVVDYCKNLKAENFKKFRQN